MFDLKEMYEGIKHSKAVNRFVRKQAITYQRGKYEIEKRHLCAK